MRTARAGATDDADDMASGTGDRRSRADAEVEVPGGEVDGDVAR
jgi:hypothetical protein